MPRSGTADSPYGRNSSAPNNSLSLRHPRAPCCAGSTPAGIRSRPASGISTRTAHHTSRYLPTYVSQSCLTTCWAKTTCYRMRVSTRSSPANPSTTGTSTTRTTRCRLLWRARSSASNAFWPSTRSTAATARPRYLPELTPPEDSSRTVRPARHLSRRARHPARHGRRHLAPLRPQPVDRRAHSPADELRRALDPTHVRAHRRTSTTRSRHD